MLGFLAETYPELQNGTWHSRDLPDDSREITFVKVTGEKGSVTTGQVVDRLANLIPTRLQSVRVLEQVLEAETGELNAGKLLALNPPNRSRALRG